MTRAYKVRKISTSERSTAASRALASGPRVRITQGQGKAILRARPMKSVKAGAK